MTAYSLRLAEKRIRELERQVAEVRSFLANEAESQDWTRPPWLEDPDTAMVGVAVRCDIDDARALVGRHVPIAGPSPDRTARLMSVVDLHGGHVQLLMECDQETVRYLNERSRPGDYEFNFTADMGLTLKPIPVHPPGEGKG